MITLPSIWLGTQSGLDLVVRAHSARMEAKGEPPPRYKVFQESDDDDDRKTAVDLIAEDSLQMVEDVAVVKVHGPLVSQADFWSLIFGEMPYDAITKATEMALEENPSSIVFSYNTPGGELDGLVATAGSLSFLQQANPEVPFLTHVQGRMLSAGYWLGSTSPVIYGEPLSEVGHIGVRQVQASVVEKLKKEGIEVFVHKAGKYKDAGSRFKKIDQQDKEYFGERLQYAYQRFVDHVAARRNLNASDHKKWADGQYFFIEQAIGLGLADRIISQSQLLSALLDTEPKGVTA